MDNILAFFHSILPDNFDGESFLRTSLILCACLVGISTLTRFIFGKRSILGDALSSAMSILFIYAVTITIYSTGVDLQFLLTPLPMIEISQDYLTLFSFEGVHYTEICSQLLSLTILAFLANLADDWIARGKNIFSWIFFRCMSVLLAMLLHLIVYSVIYSLFPDGLLQWAPTILLVVLVLAMAVGALKIVIGLFLTTVNPLIGFLYAFFFANRIGKQISKAVLTAALISGIVYLLNRLQVFMIYIAPSALIAYIPLVAVLLIIWYLIGKIFEVK